MSSRYLIGALVLFTLAGCQTAPQPQAGSLDAGFGETVKYDMALQTIDPDPVYDANDAQPGSSGALGAAAVKRYRTGQVKAVETQGTTTSQSGGSAGSSSGPR